MHSTLHGSPRCRCGSRNSVRVCDSALLRLCLDCGETYAYRLHEGRLIPFSPMMALALDEQRRAGRPLEVAS